jgi:hypothetical protein
MTAIRKKYNTECSYSCVKYLKLIIAIIMTQEERRKGNDSSSHQCAVCISQLLALLHESKKETMRISVPVHYMDYACTGPTKKF